ncbi:latent-transforming growth factor beta-binding protein 1 isoform X2 [Hydra vulgaris]|uniref:Latent-transforming growth factor beta-binding protein 1 isoform X2 n=2 Tax=Hydra vulgaris TaxID=6087 RepID=A0ABM4D4W4_HYDVU
MQKMFYAIFILLFARLALSFEDPSLCCKDGYSKGAEILLTDVTCEPDSSVEKKFSGINNIMCRGFFQQCCTITAQQNFCQMGEKLAQANYLCMKNSYRIGGEYQKICCDCCKEGIMHARKGAECSNNAINETTCKKSFENCCRAVLKTEKILSSISPTPSNIDLCSDTICDKQSSSGCIHEQGSVKCVCKNGFYSSDRLKCLDINECTSNVCPSGAQCKNTVGSFTCTCSDGYIMSDGACVPVIPQKCQNGFIFKDGICQDNDECLSGSYWCPKDSYCFNEIGSYTCLQSCEQPFYQIIQDNICKDVNECSEGTFKCPKNYECRNKQGGYDCKLTKCDVGYKLFEGYCEDVDECSEEPGICGENGICRNAYGRYFCDCQHGFHVDPFTQKCNDTNECLIDRAICEFQCKNTEGSYLCICPKGYEVRGNYCYDIDECSTNPCPDASFCFNNFGSFACINQTCPNKFLSRVGNKPSEIATCRKIEDCQGNKECETNQLHSVKRIAYKFYNRIPIRGFQFNYWTSFSRQFYSVKSEFISGNDDGVFTIENVSNEKIQIYNSKTVFGPKEIQLVMRTDVSARANNMLLWQYEYHMFFYVSEYDFH